MIARCSSSVWSAMILEARASSRVFFVLYLGAFECHLQLPVLHGVGVDFREWIADGRLCAAWRAGRAIVCERGIEASGFVVFDGALCGGATHALLELSVALRLCAVPLVGADLPEDAGRCCDCW